jgi:hypothetical protein
MKILFRPILNIEHIRCKSWESSYFVSELKGHYMLDSASFSLDSILSLWDTLTFSYWSP